MARKKGDVVIQNAPTNAPQIIKEALKVRGYTQLMVAEKLGYQSQSAVAKILGGRNLRINTLATVLDLLDFDIIIKDRNNANRENVWKIEASPLSEGDEE